MQQDDVLGNGHVADHRPDGIDHRAIQIGGRRVLRIGTNAVRHEKRPRRPADLAEVLHERLLQVGGRQRRVDRGIGQIADAIEPTRRVDVIGTSALAVDDVVRPTDLRDLKPDAQVARGQDDDVDIVPIERGRIRNEQRRILERAVIGSDHAHAARKRRITHAEAVRIEHGERVGLSAAGRGIAKRGAGAGDLAARSLRDGRNRPLGLYGAGDLSVVHQEASAAVLSRRPIHHEPGAGDVVGQKRQRNACGILCL